MPPVQPNPVAPIGPEACSTSPPSATTYQGLGPAETGTAGARPATVASPDAEAPSMTDRLKDKVTHLGEKAHQVGDNAKHAGLEKMEKAKESAAEYYQQGRDKATELTHSVENYVRTEPTKSLLAAAGVGFVLGFLLIRR